MDNVMGGRRSTDGSASCICLSDTIGSECRAAPAQRLRTDKRCEWQSSVRARRPSLQYIYPLGRWPFPFSSRAAQQSLEFLSGSRELSGGGLATASIVRRAAGAWRRPAQTLRRTASLGPCTAGQESNATLTSPTTATFTVEDFYDGTCLTPAYMMVWNATQTSTVAFQGPGNITYYDASGTTIGYATFTLSGTFTDTTLAQLAQLSFDVTSLSQSPSAPSIGAVALACGLNGQPNGLACGIGAVANVSSLSASYGATVTLSGAGTSTGSSTNVQVNGSAQAYQGALNGLSVSAGAFPAWVIAGGTQVDQATGSLTAAFNLNGVPVSMNETITDAADQATVSLSAGASGISGTVTDTQNGVVVATFTISPIGFGTISYSNGSTAQIEDFMIAG